MMQPCKPLKSSSSTSPRAVSATCDPEAREYYIGRLVAAFHGAFAQLGIDVTTSATSATSVQEEDEDRNTSTTRSIESMATFIYESMSTSARSYHHVQHVFDLIEGNVCLEQQSEQEVQQQHVLDAIAILAALFHDCVYANIDGGLSKHKQKLKGAIQEVATTTSTQLRIITPPNHEDNEPTDKLLTMVMAVFGMNYGEIVQPTKGGNEFFSALIAVRELQAWITFPDLVKIAVCIEATIPFRPINPDTGESALEQLHQRLLGIVREFPVPLLTPDECRHAVQRACLLANEDIGNFATPNHAMFMDKTWSLLPESNETLRQPYTIFEFHYAVFKMQGFFEFLSADLIFQQFRGTPSPALLDQLTQRAVANIAVGRRYLALKLISVTFLAAIAELSGGDAPISLFMGELPGTTTTAAVETGDSNNGSSPCRLEDELELRSIQEVQQQDSTSTIDVKVYRLLAEGRLSETAFDVKQSPLSAYFYGIMGDERVQQVLEGAGPLYPMSNDLACKFLKMLPFEAVRCVASLIAEKASERQQAIVDIVQSIESSSL